MSPMVPYALVLGIAFAMLDRWRRQRRGAQLHESTPQAPASNWPQDDLRERFLSTVSHELRTPLNAILGWAQMLKSGVLKPAEARHAAVAIERNVRLETKLVEALLDVSLMKQGRVMLTPRLVDLRAVVHRVWGRLRPIAEAKRLGGSCQTGSGPVRVVGDESRLEQMIEHLVGNAVKFTPAGGHVAVHLCTDGPFARLQVSDDGAGISHADLPRLSEPFFQGTDVPRAGLGLGLTFVREVVDLHRGTFSVASDGPGAGAAALVQLPLTRVPPAAAAQPLASTDRVHCAPPRP